MTTRRHLLKSLVLFIIFGCAFIPFPAHAEEVTQTYTAGQSGTFVVPDGVTQLRVTMWGGGAGGYAGRSGTYNGTAGGGAGVIVGYTLTATPGQSISYSVGTGGQGGQSQDTLGSPGGNTTFGNLIAYGGSIGTRAGNSGGAGGNATDGTYTATGGTGGSGVTKVNGGNGQAVSAGGGTLYGGGGGGAPYTPYSDCASGLGGTSYSNTTACGGYGGGGGASYGLGGNGYRNSTQADSGVNGGGGAGLWAGAGYHAGNGGNGSLQISYTTSAATYTVTPSAGAGGSISPSTPQTVTSGSTVSFTVTADTGYSIASVTGCSGTLSGSTYTTGAITGNCTVTASFAASTLSSVTLTPTAVGGGTTAQGTVQLSGPAPEGGAAVTLSSSDPSTANVPGTVMVAVGARSATFTVSAQQVSSTASVTITASDSSSTKTASITVSPSSLSETMKYHYDDLNRLYRMERINSSGASEGIELTYDELGNRQQKNVLQVGVSSVTLNPTSVAGGSTSQGTVTLSGAAPGGGAVVSLSSSNTAAATVPATVTVAAGTSSATFTASTTAVASTTTVTITASYGGTTQSGSLTVTTGTIFSDVASTYWAYNYILSVYNAGIMGGCSQNPLTFCPSSQVTRGDTAAFIIRAKFGESFTYTQTPYYTDVPANHPYFKYVQKMKDSGITTTTGTYYVSRAVTRGETAAFIIRAKFGESFTYTQTPYYTDVPADHVYFKYVQKMKDTGITTTTGTYDVDGTVARDQMAAFLGRAFLGMQ